MYRLSLLFLVFSIFSTEIQAQTAIDSTLSEHLRRHDLKEIPVSVIIDKNYVGLLGGSATGLLSRIAGVSFQGEGLASFRGLNPRYTTILVDGLSAPITEQNIKAFALGLLPGSTLQALKVYKSASPTNPAEWGGATVNINTNADVSENSQQLAFGIGYHHNFTFNDFRIDTDYGTEFTDYLGFGANRLDFTRTIPDRLTFQALPRNEAAKQAANLRNTWTTQTVQGSPDIDLAYTVSRIISEKGDQKISTITSATFNRSQSGMEFNRARYGGYTRDDQGKVNGSRTLEYMNDGVYSSVSQITINSGWHYKWRQNQSINLNLSYSNFGETYNIGRDLYALTNNQEVVIDVKDYRQKQIFMTNLSGANQLNDKISLTWSTLYSNFNRRQPDLRGSAAQRRLNNPNDPLLIYIPESAKANTGSRFSSQLVDNLVAGRADFTFVLSPDNFSLKAGLFGEVYTRQFDARLLTTVRDDFTRYQLRFQPWSNIDTIFSAQNYGPDGYYLYDGTIGFDSYNATNKTFAAYASANKTLGKVNSELGFRVESFDQELNTGDVNVKNSPVDLLPFLSFNYAIDKANALKFGYSRSLNRPAFRELSPFIFYDFDYRADVQGSPDLKIAKLDNIDLSYLMAFGDSEYFSASAFYKYIQNPIEMIYVIRADSPQFTYNNVASAEVAGIELEFAKVLSHSSASIFNQFLLNVVASFTDSQIDLGPNSSEAASNRPLQGQIPVLLTAGLTYANATENFQMTLDYTYKGKYLYAVGDGQETFPWYVAPQNLLNFGTSYQFENNLNLKLIVTNILNAPFQQIEDANLNGQIGDQVDNQVQYGLSYQSAYLTLAYTF